MGPSDWRRFSSFEVNLQTGELRTIHGPVPLERQPTRALRQLVANAGRLVPRDELRQAIWPADTHVDFDRGLNYCLRQIRVALGDDAKEPQFIETVPRQGYRFIAPLALGPDARPSDTRQEPRRRGAASSHRRARWLVALAVAAGLLVTVIVEAGPGGQGHHRITVQVARAVHDFLF
jgi:DNA-binding winged helix-turn-helix (wHTH) protein